MPAGRLQRALTSAQRRSHVTESDPVKANFPAAGGDEDSRGQTHRNSSAVVPQRRSPGVMPHSVQGRDACCVIEAFKSSRSLSCSIA